MPKAGITLTQELWTEYQNLYDTCVFSPSRADEIKNVADKVLAGKDTYQLLAEASNDNMPWYVIGNIHWLESNCNFDCHLHNGDPLTARTVHVPANRPPADAGDPPFSFEFSARDALNYEQLTLWNEWRVPGCLFIWEKYNGFGYRLHNAVSPYLWGGSQHYTKGMFPRDHDWQPEMVSRAIGSAVILKWMDQHGQL